MAKRIKEERDSIETLLEEKKKYEQEARKLYNVVQDAFCKYTKIESISNLPIGQTVRILGFPYSFGNSAKMVLQWNNNIGVFRATQSVYKAISLLPKVHFNRKNTKALQPFTFQARANN